MINLLITISKSEWKFYALNKRQYFIYEVKKKEMMMMILHFYKKFCHSATEGDFFEMLPFPIGITIGVQVCFLTSVVILYTVYLFATGSLGTINYSSRFKSCCLPHIYSFLSDKIIPIKSTMVEYSPVIN